MVALRGKVRVGVPAELLAYGVGSAAVRDVHAATVDDALLETIPVLVGVAQQAAHEWFSQLRAAGKHRGRTPRTRQPPVREVGRVRHTKRDRLEAVLRQ